MIGMLYPIFFLITFMYPCFWILRNIVTEKERGIRETLKTMVFSRLAGLTSRDSKIWRWCGPGWSSICSSFCSSAWAAR